MPVSIAGPPPLVDASWVGVACTLAAAASTLLVRAQRERPAAVRTSGARAPAPRRADPCATCGGVGRVGCAGCAGAGRVNRPRERVLPRGEWPVLCAECRASGLVACPRCCGTGERPPAIGFRLPVVER